MDIKQYQKGADELLARVSSAMRGGDNSIHPQSLLCALGAVAGYACQEDVRNIYLRKRGLAEDLVFNIVAAKNGRRYYFGDLLNEPLVNGQNSVWALIGGAVKQRGGTLPDVNDIFRYVSYVIGGERFGRVRSCETGEDMETYLKNLWQPLKAIAKKYANSTDEEGGLHVVFGIALQKAVYLCGGSMNITECARIAMESAVSMSKVII